MTIRSLLVLKRSAEDRISKLRYDSSALYNELNDLYRELERMERTGDADPALVHEIEQKREALKFADDEVAELKRAIDDMLDTEV